MTRIYSTGTAQVANGDTTVTITGGVLSATNCGADFDVVIEGFSNFIAERTDTTHFELALPHDGPGGAGLSYAIRRITAEEVATAVLNARLATFIEMLNRLGATGIQVNAFGNLADRDDFDLEGQGFVFVSLDGDGDEIDDPVLFIKASPTSGDWSEAITVQGPKGDQGGDDYDVAVFVPFKPTSAEVVLRHVFTRTVEFPGDLAGSRAKVVTAATAEAVFSLKRNGVEFGTVTVAGAGTTGTFAGAATIFAAGDELTIAAPNPADATLAFIIMTLAGEKP